MHVALKLTLKTYKANWITVLVQGLGFRADDDDDHDDNSENETNCTPPITRRASKATSQLLQT